MNGLVNQIKTQKDASIALAKITNSLKDQVTILKQEVKTLGKRGAVVNPEESAELEEAIVREIKRRRRDPHDQNAPVTLDERRASDKATVSKILKDN